ncbi:MAG: D-glycero-beta-D-manno-heptose 1-phosphate adenylyltransferase [Bacteroidetes bacterium]|nr:MAG: D-glycero-beta-D-manno-heptose 1-phosphate adenylyltransferase [Bacteroidota bacterium]
MIDVIKSKIQSWENIRTTVEQWKSEGQKVVFTNGCFDILHYGHVYYLSEARALGDRLVIGLNSRESVSRLKGPNRPINDDETRQYLLASLQYVDAVVVFEEDTPLELIEVVKPDILVKGGDYTIETIVGADIVLNNGGEVKSLAFVPGYSTTSIEEKLKKGE